MALPLVLLAVGVSGVVYVADATYKYLRENRDKQEDEKGGIKQDSQKITTLVDRKYQQKIDAFFGDEQRERQLQSISENPIELSDEDKELNRRLGLVTANVCVAACCGWFAPSAVAITAPITLWSTLPRFSQAYQTLFKERRVSIAMIDSVLFSWTLLSGFFFGAALGSFLINLSWKLLSKTKNNSQSRLANLFRAYPRTVWKVVEGVELETPFEDLKVGDVVLVHAGETIPADGTIIDGVSLIDQHALTGEAQPAEKGVGDQVLASTLVLSGRIQFVVERSGIDMAASQIIEILNQTSEYKTTFEMQGEHIVDRFALPTLVLSGLAYPLAGTTGSLGVLWSCPGLNMRLFAPLSTLNFLRMMAQNNILVKDGQVLESLASVDTIVFDKTGTLTLEEMQVGKIYTCHDYPENTVLASAAIAEHRQTHPIARAILAAADQQALRRPAVDDLSYEVGYGIKVSVAGQTIRVGSKHFMELERIAIPAEMTSIIDRCADQGVSLVFVSIDEILAGAIELKAALRPEAKQLVSHLHEQGISTYIVSGDQEQPTRALAQDLGIEHYFANTLPKQKAEIIGQLKQEGKTVCFIGDGINDAIALKEADVSVSFRGATTAAIDTAQIILMDENLAHIRKLFDIGMKFDANQNTNKTLSIVPSVLSLGGVFLLRFGMYGSMLVIFSGVGLCIWNATRPLRDPDIKDAD